MLKVKFVHADGQTTEVVVPVGSRLLDVAQDVGVPLEGTCEGNMSCATCHLVISEKDFLRLGPVSSEEESLLDFTPDVTRTSRLSCQVYLGEDLDELEAHVPC